MMQNERRCTSKVGIYLTILVHLLEFKGASLFKLKHKVWSLLKELKFGQCLALLEVDPPQCKGQLKSRHEIKMQVCLMMGGKITWWH